MPHKILESGRLPAAGQAPMVRTAIAIEAGAYGSFPTFAYNLQLISQVGKVKEGSTAKGYVNARIGVRFTAAGNITMSLSSPDFRRF